MKKYVLHQEMPLSEYMPYWFYTFSFGKLKPSTRTTYKYIIDKHVCPRIGDISLCNIDTLMLQEYFNDCKEHGNLVNNGELSVKTLTNIKNMMNKAFEKAVELELVDKNYLKYVELPKPEKTKILVFTPEEEKLIRKAALLDDNLEYGFSYWLADTFGARNGEICGLRWSDIDLDNNEVHIGTTVKRLMSYDPCSPTSTYMNVGSPKTYDSIRTIPFTEDIKATILDVRERRNKSGYYAKRKASTEMRDFVFLSAKGNYADTATFSKNFKKFLRSLGIDDSEYTYHSLRHTFATRAITKGVDPKTVSELLGHSDVGFTLKRYTHPQKDHKLEAMKEILSF